MGWGGGVGMETWDEEEADMGWGGGPYPGSMGPFQLRT